MKTTQQIFLAGLTLLASTWALAEPVGQLNAETCVSLSGRAVPGDQISLPTSGARVTETVWHSGTDNNGSYCQVMGIIMPVRVDAPNIEWQANLPEFWHGKMMQRGGGGFNGRIPRNLNYPALSLENVPSALARGYVTLGSDSGHQSDSGSDASFGRNAEAWANYAYMHIKKTHDTVNRIVSGVYQAPVQHVFFSGGSTGGREALTAAMRWPETYDGILSNYPSATFMGLRLWGAALTQAIYPDNSAGWIPPELVKQIAARAIETCDGLDGVEDGLVSNMQGCRAQAGDLVEGFRCAEGQDARQDQCLNQTQIDRTIAIYHDGYELPYELANGFRHYRGYNNLEGVLMNVGTQPDYAWPPRSGPQAHHADRAFQFFTNVVMPDNESDFADFDIMAPGKYQDRLQEISGMIDATNPDLSAFADNGGKLILLHGIEDQSISPLTVVQLYKDIQASVGEEKTGDFMRFYLVPGLAHGGGNMSPAWDNLSALERWVDEGIPPVAQIVTDDTDSDTRGRTRPLCEYPAWPKYTGTGDINQASSFNCIVE